MLLMSSVKPESETPLRKPAWLRVKAGGGEAYTRLSGLVSTRGLHTVCEEAQCPNRGECWEHGQATLMILGDKCTRACRFCAVGTGPDGVQDCDEPGRVATAVKMMGIDDVVITSVTRDDLPDGGAGIWADTIRLIRDAVPGISLEVLIPDFNGSESALGTVLDAGPDVLGHNLETVPSLYDRVRPAATYDQSLAVLRFAIDRGFIAKTSLMVGMGETDEEILNVMEDAATIGCHIFYLGQYLRPTVDHLPISRYVEPAIFDMYRERGLQMGIPVVVSAPLVRSSYYSELQDRYVRNSV